MNIETMLAPLAVDGFLSRYWGQSYLLQKGTPGRYDKLLGWDELSSILVQTRWKTPRIRLSKDGKFVPPSEYLNASSDGGGLIRQAGITKYLREGATLIIDSIEEQSPSLRDLVRSLERHLREYVQVNAYASWGSSRGFDAHWDNHDVFILQISGRKDWKIYGETIKYPVARHRLESHVPPAKCLWEGFMESGDLLYMPRGCWHVASAVAEPTLHLTFSIPNRTGLDLLPWLSEQLAQSSDIFRKDLPKFGSDEEKRVHFLELRRDLNALFADGIIDRFLNQQDEVAPQRSDLTLPWLISEHTLPPGASFEIVSLLPRAPVFRSEPNSNKLEFVALASKFSFAQSTRPILEAVLSGNHVRFLALVESNRGIPESHIRVLLSRLAVMGLVWIKPIHDDHESTRDEGGSS